MAADDFDIPADLDPQYQKAAEVILAVIRKDCGPKASGGGCKIFKSREQWAPRGERWGNDSELVIVHDGGDQAPYFNPDYGDGAAVKRMQEALDKLGMYSEQCTSWHSAVYPNSRIP